MRPRNLYVSSNIQSKLLLTGS
jgi:periodic tryptophan protein 2